VLGDRHAQRVEIRPVQRLAPAEQFAEHVVDPGVPAGRRVALPGGVLHPEPLPGGLLQHIERRPGLP